MDCSLSTPALYKQNKKIGTMSSEPGGSSCPKTTWKRSTMDVIPFSMESSTIESDPPSSICLSWLVTVPKYLDM